MKSAVVVSAVFPYPINNGKRVVLSGLMRYLVDRLGAGNVTLLYIGHEESVTSEVDYKIRTISPASRLEQVVRMAAALSSISRRSLQEAAFFSKKLQNDLMTELSSLRPDLVVVDTIRIGQFFEKQISSAHMVLYLDDLFSVRYSKMLEASAVGARTGLNALGNFGASLPAFAQRLASHPVIERWLLRVEQPKVHRRENEVVRFFNMNLLINSAEAELLARRVPSVSVGVIKPLLPAIPKTLKRNLDKDRPRFMFLGDLRIPHNRVSLERFLSSQLGQIRELIPNVEIVIVGPGGDNKFRDFINPWKSHVTYLGFVEDLEPLLASMNALLVPLLFGSGVKIKTLEAFARGLPVITTDFGIEGINTAGNAECIIENDLSKYAACMKRLVDPTYNESMSLNAFKFFHREYSSGVVFSEYDQIFLRQNSSG